LPESSKPKTASEKQIAANRANAQHSSGPRTAEGKARSSQNARKYGFYGNAYNVPQLEDLEDVANLREDFAAAYHPRNPAEMEAVEQIAIAHQARLRAIRLEVGLFTSMLDQVYSIARDNVPGICDDLAAAATPRGKTIPEIRNFMLAEGFRRLKPELWSGFLRHRAQVERFYHQAVEDFDQLKARRDEPAEDLRNEPNSASQPEETEPLTPIPNEPENGPNGTEIEPENDPGRPPCPTAPECPPECPPGPESNPVAPPLAPPESNQVPAAEPSALGFSSRPETRSRLRCGKAVTRRGPVGAPVRAAKRVHRACSARSRTGLSLPRPGDSRATAAANRLGATAAANRLGAKSGTVARRAKRRQSPFSEVRPVSDRCRIAPNRQLELHFPGCSVLHRTRRDRMASECPNGIRRAQYRNGWTRRAAK
jgi:hypothetical protein